MEIGSISMLLKSFSLSYSLAVFGLFGLSLPGMVYPLFPLKIDHFFGPEV